MVNVQLAPGITTVKTKGTPWRELAASFGHLQVQHGGGAAVLVLVWRMRRASAAVLAEMYAEPALRAAVRYQSRQRNPVVHME